MTPSNEPVNCRITDIKCSKPPGIKFLKKPFCVQITVEKETKGFKTLPVQGGGSALSWDDNYILGGASSSRICIEVFQRRYFHKNTRIGMFEDTIGSLFTDGSSEVSRELQKAGSNVPHPVNITFSIHTLSKDADINHLRAEEALPQARHGLSEMKGAPSMIDKAGTPTGIAVQIADTTRSFIDVWSSVLEKLELFTKITDGLAEVHPYAQTACMILSAIPKAIIAQKERDDAVYHLMETIYDIHSFLKDAEPLKTIESHSKVIVALGSLTVECAYLIRDYSMDKNFWKRILKLTWSGVESTIKQYEERFKDLKAQFQGSAVVNIDITAMRCLRKVENMNTSLIIDDLPYADGAAFDPTKSCIRGTRKAALNEIHQWINQEDRDDTARILVLTGVAGVGKSAIANSIAEHYDAVKHLGSFVSFNRADQARRNPGNLLSTIARDIADLDPNWKSALYDAVENNHSLRKNTSPIRQMESFVLEPAKALAIVGPIVIVIDALDESGDALARGPLLKALAENASKLPPNIRILITSRPEDDIVQTLSDKLPNIQQKAMATMDAATDADIAEFIKQKLSDIVNILESDPEYSNGKWVGILVGASGGLFEWAATACRAIRNGPRGYRKTELLRKFVKEGSGLDQLYTTILCQTFQDGNDPTVMSRFRRVLGGIIAAREPLPIASHCSLQSEGDDAGFVLDIIGPLGSVLHGVTQNEGPVRALHTSFFDFLQDPKRSKDFAVDATKEDRNLVLGCLRVMETLRFNICGLATSHVRNADVHDLPALVQTNITPHLLYACRFLGVHLVTVSYEKQVGSALEDFLHEHFLHWLEVLSLTKLVNTASKYLSSILKWIQSHNTDLAAFAKDAKMFVNVFAPAISQSAPHIYLSALPFAPTQSLVSRQYLPKYESTIHLKSGSIQRWPAALKTLEGHKYWVRAVAYSPDGTHLVSGSDDNTIRVWDAETGEAVGEPLSGHSGSIYCVAYSSNGAHLASGSEDKTIRIWDAETGESVGEPLRGHTGGIWSIAYSPDGRHIVSGSVDETLQIWDAETGQVVGEPLKGHTDPIYSVAYCPDGAHIISGSQDKTIRIWDAETGKAVGEPLSGHTNTIHAVAYSLYGRHIVSCSDDGTIRIWSAETGEPIGKPICRSAGENTHRVWSVACSPDGKHIVTGWDDGMVCVWDTETGEAIGEPFEGHTSYVSCVAYSPDGTGIVSCSDDKTVRVWNAEKSEAAGVQCTENTSKWNSVAYSPGGKHIVSASKSGMICVWDAETGSAVADPLKPNVGDEHDTMATTFLSDGMHIVSCDHSGGIQTWDSETGQSVGDTIKLDLALSNDSLAAFSSGGTHIAVQDYDKIIRVLDTETGKAVGMLFGMSINIFSAPRTLLRWGPRQDPARAFSEHPLNVHQLTLLPVHRCTHTATSFKC